MYVLKYLCDESKWAVRGQWVNPLCLNGWSPDPRHDVRNCFVCFPPEHKGIKFLTNAKTQSMYQIFVVRPTKEAMRVELLA